MIPLLLALLPLAQDADPIPKIIAGLSSEEVAVRDRSEKEILALPVERVPALIEAAERSGDAEVRSRVARASLPARWVKLLRGTVGEARRDLALIRAFEGERRDQERAMEQLLLRLDDRPIEETGALLRPLLDSENPGERDFALLGLKAHPPKDLSPVVGLLSDSWVGARAADLLVATGDASVVPAAFELFRGGKKAAARILLRHGAGGRVRDLLRVFDADAELRLVTIQILQRTGGKEAEEALLEILNRTEGHLDAASALSRVGSPEVLPPLKAWALRTTGDTYWDHWFLPLRDTEWARRRLGEVIAGTCKETGRATWYAWTAGPATREPILTALRDPATKLSLRKQLLPALGAVARPEDVAYLVEQLRDDRLVNEAAEALDLTGDPARARPMMEAFKRTGHTGPRPSQILALPPERIEEDLLEILSDRKGYEWQAGIVLPLVERRPSPRLREALFEARLGHEILSRTVGPSDRPRVEKLRRSVSTEDRAFGLHLALRLGDESAAPPLADLLLPAKANSPFPILGSVFVLWPDPPGEAWAKAVEEAWRRNGREEWMVERWLAARGVPDALERIRKHGRPFRMHDANPEDPGAALLARRGEAAALGRLLERAIGGPLPPATERGFLAGLDPAWRLRLLAAARRQSLQPSSGVLRLAALAGLPEAVPLYRSAVCGGANRADGGDLGDVVTVPCLEALAKLGVRDAIPEIRLHLRGRPRFAAAAALALARLGDRESLPSILALAEQPDEIANEEWDVDRPRPDGPSRRVWDAALEALEILTGEKPRGTSTLERRAWWRDWNAARRDR